MKKFRIETEVKATITFEYYVEAESLEEAIQHIRGGERRGSGMDIRDEVHWGTEVITAHEKYEG
jgi:hypothetical protein